MPGIAGAQESQVSPSKPAISPSSCVLHPAQGLIKLDLTVRDKAGKPVPGLKPQDVTLLDNGQPEKLVSFQAFDGITNKPDPPVEIILVLDALDLSPIQFAGAEREVETFIHQNQLHLVHPVVVYRISDAGLSVVPEDLLARGLMREESSRVNWRVPGHLGSDGWGTVGIGASGTISLHAPAPSDAVGRNLPNALVALGSIAIEERRRPGRKLMFWLGPGWQSHRAAGSGLFGIITELSTRLREARIQIWGVPEWRVFGADDLPYQDSLRGVTSGEKVVFDNLALQVIAAQSGGGELNLQNDLTDLIEKQVEEADNSYTLTFDPPRTRVVDEYHDLKVQVVKPGLTASTNTGYYDEPTFYDQPSSQINRVPVAELEQVLSEGRSNSDFDIERQLSGMELTERISSARLVTLKAALRGEKARRALVALADQSVFLAPPTGDILSMAPPDTSVQQQMIARSIDYLTKTIRNLPNFLAVRTTTRYEEPATNDAQTLPAWKTLSGDQSLHEAETSKTTVLVRNGREIAASKPANGKTPKPIERTLDSSGAFGPILNIVLGTAVGAPGRLTWRRWENSASATQAVFGYDAPADLARFQCGFSCIAQDDRSDPVAVVTGAHGEIAIDPGSGAILRLTVEANLEPRLPLDRSGIMVEYSPVTIGGITYICPSRSVSLARQRMVVAIDEWGESFKVYGHFETVLNDMAFEKYHLFRSESHILPDFTPATEKQ